MNNSHLFDICFSLFSLVFSLFSYYYARREFERYEQEDVETNLPSGRN